MRLPIYLALDYSEGARTDPLCKIDRVFVDFVEKVLLSEDLIHQLHAQSFSGVDLPGGK